jgi:hypothetical protein
MEKSQNAFTIIEGLLLLTIVSLIGTTGWYVIHASNSANQSLRAANSVKSDIQKAPSIKTFDDCKKITGSKIQETYPETCVTKSGQKFTNASDQTVTWVKWEAPDKSFKMKIPDGWNLDQNSTTRGELETWENALAIKPGTKGTFYVTPGLGKDHDSGLTMSFIEPSLSEDNLKSAVKGMTKQLSLKTKNGVEILKYYNLQLQDSEGPGLKKGGKSYVYAIFSNKKLVLTYYSFNPVQTDYHSNVEAALETVEIP